MATRKYTVLIDNVERNLEAHWKGIFKDVSLHLDGIEIGKVPDKKTLNNGCKISHPSGEFFIKLTKSGFNTDLEVNHNGTPVGGSAKDPAQKIKTGIFMISFLSGLNMLVGGIAVFGRIPMLLNMGFGFYNILISILYLIAFATAKRFNRLAGLIAGFSIFAMDTFFAMNVMIQKVPQSAGGTVVARIFIGAPILFGMIAAYKHRKSIIEDGNLMYEKNI